MKLPFINQKVGLVVAVVVMLGMLGTGIYLWPEGQSFTETYHEAQEKSDSLKSNQQPETAE